MKEHPIIFSTEMVKAILAGRKTMTRRIVKNYVDSRPPRTTDVYFEDWHGKEIKCPYGIHGDNLWVREAWKIVGWDFEDGEMTTEYRAGGKLTDFYYDPEEDSMWMLKQVEQMEAGGIIKKDPDNEEMFLFTKKYHPFSPSIHMPKEAARIFLEVTNVRVERLHDISEADIVNEGVRVPCSENGIMFKAGEENGAWQFMPEQWKLDRHIENRGKEKYVHKDFDFLFAHWAELWCEINGRYSWNENPWVWVIEFKVLSTTGRSAIKLNSEQNAQECDATKAS